MVSEVKNDKVCRVIDAADECNGFECPRGVLMAYRKGRGVGVDRLDFAACIILTSGIGLRLL